MYLTSHLFREEVLKWNGWGYKDSGFVVNDKDNIEFTGKGRYTDCGCTCKVCSIGCKVSVQKMPSSSFEWHNWAITNGCAFYIAIMHRKCQPEVRHIAGSKYSTKLQSFEIFSRKGDLVVTRSCMKIAELSRVDYNCCNSLAVCGLFTSVKFFSPH